METETVNMFSPGKNHSTELMGTTWTLLESHGPFPASWWVPHGRLIDCGDYDVSLTADDIITLTGNVMVCEEYEYTDTGRDVHELEYREVITSSGDIGWVSWNCFTHAAISGFVQITD